MIRIIGKSPLPTNNYDHSTAKIKSAKPYVNKRVFGIYNVALSETVQSMEVSIAEACGVNPISCFQVKSRDAGSAAFRVCINDDITEKFINSTMLWASGIIIKPWTFKPKENVAPTVTTAPRDTDNLEINDITNH